MQKDLTSWTDSPCDSQKKVGRQIDVWIDGLCEPTNPGGTACIGFVIKDNGVTISQGSCCIGKGARMTSNVAEYTALIHAFEEVMRQGLQNERLVIRSDSMLVVNQMNGKWGVKAPLIMPLYKRAKNLASKLNCQIEWIRREENEEADKLSRDAYKGSQEQISTR